MKTEKSPRGLIVVTGMAVYLPLPGVVFQVLHYLTGLRRLGYDAFYIEDSTRWVYDLVVGDVVPDPGGNVAIVAAVLDSNGFAGRWAFRSDHQGGRCYGLTEAQLSSLYRDADALLNVTGQTLHEDQLACRRRIYIESDPFATQVRLQQGDAEEHARLAAHDTHFTFGENIGTAECGIPITGIDWLPTRQPVEMALWQPPPGVSAGTRYTTITSWINHVPSVIHDGEPYHWQKDRQFEKFLDLPHRSPASFELASNGDAEVIDMLTTHGWKHVPANEVATDADSYRAYLWGSRGEFTVARDQYVRPRTGWFSDRSACYLAAGRPVITQETAFSRFLPVGRGLFAFTTLDEIVSAVETIEADYEAHSGAAREIAAEYFAAEKVVESLMTRAGL